MTHNHVEDDDALTYHKHSETFVFVSSFFLMVYPLKVLRIYGKLISETFVSMVY